jgi:hypothetical protein
MTYTQKGLADASDDEIEKIFDASPPATLASIVGFDFQGWNVPKFSSVLGIRKFIKGFFGDPTLPQASGYNMPVEQNSFDEPWKPKQKDGKDIRYWFFGVLPVSRVPDAKCPNTLVVDYRKWPANPRISPITYTVDYLVAPNPGNSDFLIGKSYLQSPILTLKLGFFLIQRFRPSTYTP